MTTDACPGPEDLLTFLHGEGKPELAKHLEACAACRSRANELRRLERAVRASAPERESASCPPADTFRDLLSGRLAAEARHSLEIHAARCRRCLDVLAAAHDETVLERMSLSPGLRARLEQMAPAPIPEVPTRPAVRPRTRRVRILRLTGPGRPPWVPFAAAAALFLAFVGVVMVSTSSPPKPASKPREVVRTPEPQEDFAAIERAIAEREARIRRQQEQRAQLELEQLRQNAELEAIDEARRKQEDARRLALERQQEEERRKAELELRRLEEQKQKTTAELKKTEDTRRQVDSQVAAQIIAHVERVQGQVFIVEGATRTPAKAGATVASGQALETVGRFSGCSVRFVDQTRLELASDTNVRELSEKEAEGAGKRIHLAKGELTAVVRKQPAGRPLIFPTPHGEAQVVGTTLRLLVDDLSTRLDVIEGKVRLTRKDGKAVEVATGHFAVAATGVDPVARRPMLVEPFEDGRAIDRIWRLLRPGKDVSAAIRDGKLDFSLLRPSTQGEVSEIHSRLAYPAPMKVSMDVEISHDHPDLLAGFTFVPAESEPKADNKDAILFTIAGGRRGVNLGLGKWGWRGLQNASESAPAPRRERWMLELEGEEARLQVEGKEIFRQKHGGKVHTHYHLRLEGTAFASTNLPAGAYVRYDNLRVELLTR